MKILFITAHRLGDAVLSTAALSALQQYYYSAQFTIVCGPDVVDVFRHMPRCDKVIALRKSSYNRHWLSLWKKCISQRWFLIVDLRSSLVSFALWSRRRIVIRGGRRSGHKIEQHARALGISLVFYPRLWLDSSLKEKALRILPITKKWAAFAPTAGSPQKVWSSLSFIALGRFLERLGFNIVIFYGPGEGEYAQAMPVVKGLPHARDSGGQYTLDEVACLLHRCSLFVGNDSGLMHMAAALGVPTLGLFGPSCVSQYKPIGSCTATVCSPGIEGKGSMEQLKSDTVIESVRTLLHRANDQRK